MPLSAQQRKTVDALFRAMQSGPDGEAAMMSLFAEDAVLVEPFSGRPQTHIGKAAIRQNFRDQWKNPPPDLTLTVDRVDLDGRLIRAEWTCTSPVFPSPMRGYDLFTLNDAGQIVRLEIIVTDAPPMG
jgi:ketosteroid isomerase-like protein